jgi:hypothetical protein
MMRQEMQSMHYSDHWALATVGLIVNRSSSPSQASASSRFCRHISSEGCSPAQHAGLSGRPKIAQRKSWSSCKQAEPAGLPRGMPGIGELIDGAMQHAPHPGRHCISVLRRSRAVADG